LGWFLVADGSDAALIAGLQAAAEQEGATVELVAPAIGGVETSDGKRIEADQQIDGGPSVLYDAVAWFFLRQAHPSWPANRRHGTSSPTPTPTANSSATPVTQHRCSTPPASASCGTTASSNSAATEAPPASSPPAGSSGSGNVRPRPDAGFLAGDPPPSPVHLCPGLRPASTEQGTAAA
jgi:hypothetical protein